MTINRTTLLDLPLPVTGTESGTWGDVTNNGLSQYVDIAVAGMNALTSSDFTAGALTISNTLGTSAATNIAAGSAQYATIKVSSLAQNSTITAPASNRSYRIVNADSTYSLTIKASGQTGITFLPGQTGVVAFTGTDYEVVGVVNAASSTDNAVPKFDGTTGQIIQNTGVTIDDSNNVSGVAQLNATTADLTNIEVTNIKAKDGTSAGSIADSTGVVTLASSVLTTTDINGGTIDGAVIGGSSAAAGSFTTLGASSTATFAAGAEGTPAITTTGDTNTGIFFPAADTIAFAEGGAEAMRIDSSGNVGIGCVPSSIQSGFDTLQIGGNLTLNVDDTGAGAGVYMGNNVYRDSGDSRWEYIYTDEASQYLQVSGEHIWRYAGSGSANTAITWSEAMRIDSSGNVGIGTSSPATKLHNAGTTLLGTGTWPTVSIGLSGSRVGVLSTTEDALLFIGSTESTVAADNGGRLLFGAKGTTGLENFCNAAIGGYRANAISGNFETYLNFVTSDSAGTTQERMRITSDGKVGIGTTSPAQSLDTTGKIRVRDGGNTTTPSIQMGSTGVDGFSLPGTNVIAFITNSSERARITSGGYFKASNTGSYADSTSTTHEFNNSANAASLRATSTSATYNGVTIISSAARDTTNTSYYHLGCYKAGSNVLLVADSGDVTNINNSYGAISDVKLKQDIVDAASQWDDIKNLRVRKFHLKSDPDGFLQMGLVAQEAELVSPGLIDEHPDYEEVEVPVLDDEGNPVLNEDGTPQVTKERNALGTTTKAIKYSVLYMKAVKALQEAMERIETLEAKVAALEAQ
jgi:hypothetical protein